MRAKNSQRAISFGLWRPQTYDHQTLQSGSHSKPFQPLHELCNVKKQNRHHDDKGCPQQYFIAGIGNRSFVDVNVKFQAENFGFGDK